MGSLSVWHWLVILLLVLLIFGSKKLRSFGSDLGASVRGFKDGLKTAKADASEVKENIGSLADEATARSHAKEKTAS